MPTARPELDIAAHCIAARLRILNRVVTAVYEDALRPHGLRVSQMNILAAIAAHSPIQQAEVGRALRLEKSTLSRDLDRMFAHGWVRASAGAGRAVVLEATDAGRGLLAAVLPAWLDAQREATRLLRPPGVAAVAEAVEGLWAETG